MGASSPWSPPGDSSARAAAWAQLAAAAYLQLIEWVPLSPWNDLSRGNGQEGLDVVLGIAMLALAAGTLARKRAVMALAVLGYGVWLALQIQTWWVPYFFGASPRWARIYSIWFGRTVKFLPAIGDHPIPDACHVVLHVLLIAAGLLTARALLRGHAVRT